MHGHNRRYGCDKKVMEILSHSLNEKWTDEENAALREAVKKHGKDFEKIQKEIPTKRR